MERVKAGHWKLAPTGVVFNRQNVFRFKNLRKLVFEEAAKTAPNTGKICYLYIVNPLNC
jgi:hypothetical protein